MLKTKSMTNEEAKMREIALTLAVQTKRGDDTTEILVDRAEKFYRFLAGADAGQ